MYKAHLISLTSHKCLQTAHFCAQHCRLGQNVKHLVKQIKLATQSYTKSHLKIEIYKIFPKSLETL